MPVQTSDDSDRLIGFWLKAAQNDWGFRWGIIFVDKDALVGHIGFNSLSECSEIAYHMNPKYWGNRFMTEEARAAISWRHSSGAAKNRGLHRTWKFWFYCASTSIRNEHNGCVF
jgi:RimJ/RimL family protein N-acetyltransferase